MTLRLVHTAVSEETVAMLEQLLNDVRAGHFRGVAFIAVGPRWNYVGHVTGIAKQNTTFTVGALLSLAHSVIPDNTGGS